MDGGVYEIESAYVELSEVPNPFDVVRVNSAVKAFRFIMKQSYICALIAMMVSPVQPFTLIFRLSLEFVYPHLANLVITRDRSEWT